MRLSFPKQLFLLLFLCVQGVSFAQQDTNYYRKYTNRLCVSIYQSIARTYNFDIAQLMDHTVKKDSSRINYNADANLVTGLEFTYDKFSVSFGYRSTPPKTRSLTGNTAHSNYAVAIGGNKFFFHGSFMKYIGFYDLNTAKNDTSYRAGEPYYQNPGMSTTAYRLKYLRFSNSDRFSYKSGYAGNYRQLKSCAGWVVVSNLYYQKMHTDSSFIPDQLLSSYGTYADWNGLNVFGLSAGGGGSGNLVIGKRFFFNLTFVMGFESQWRTYGHLSGETGKRNYISISGDARAAFGFNSKNFFLTISSMNDFSFYNSGQVEVKSRFLSGYFTLGYRFKMKNPKIYQKFQETKVYKML